MVQAFQSLDVRPYELMHVVSEIGAGRKDDLGNGRLTFILRSVRQNPVLPLTLRCNVNTADVGMALRDELKDLDVLQRLGLEYGNVLPARALMARLYECTPSTLAVCGHGDGAHRGREWRVCGGPDGDPGYVRARHERLGSL